VILIKINVLVTNSTTPSSWWATRRSGTYIKARTIFSLLAVWCKIEKWKNCGIRKEGKSYFLIYLAIPVLSGD